jgi:hypothetical protein
MKYLANIITTNNKLSTIDFVNKTSNVDRVNFTLPTLVIGKELAEGIFGKENIHILNKQIRGDIYWTYSKMEKRNDFEKDYAKFNNFIFKKLKTNVKYAFFNIFTEPLYRIKAFLNFIANDQPKTVYRVNNHVYIYCNGVVVGLSLEDIEYAGIDKEKAFNRIKENAYNVVIEGIDFMSYKMQKQVEGVNYIVPYLYALKKNI